MVLALANTGSTSNAASCDAAPSLFELEPKAFDLLAFLVQHRDHVISKDDLLQAVWHGRIVSELALTTRINAARRALGDDGATQRLIRTFTRKGIRFVGEVIEIPDQVGPAVADKPSIAVLPFRNMSGDPEQEYFAYGMVEEIIAALARIRWLFVITRNSSFATRASRRCEPDGARARRPLRARRLGAGGGNRMRIVGQLIDSTTGAHVWVDRFEGTLDDIFQLQDRVASGVVGAIEPRLRRAEAERAVRKPTASLDAYDLYWRAQAQAYKRTRESLAESKDGWRVSGPRTRSRLWPGHVANCLKSRDAAAAELDPTLRPGGRGRDRDGAAGDRRRRG